MPLRLKKEPIKRKPSDREKGEIQNEEALLKEDGDKSDSQGTEDSTPSEEDISDEGQTRAIFAITGEDVTPDGGEEVPEESEDSVGPKAVTVNLAPIKESRLSPEERELFITLDREVEE